jgi:hypothetical protein
MADPVFDEDVIIDMLKAPAGALETTGILSQALMMALADLYDRRADRSFVMEHASGIVQAYAILSRRWMLASIKEMHESGILNEIAFDQAQVQITESLNERLPQVIAMVEKLKECPTSRDKIH